MFHKRSSVVNFDLAWKQVFYYTSNSGVLKEKKCKYISNSCPKNPFYVRFGNPITFSNFRNSYFQFGKKIKMMNDGSVVQPHPVTWKENNAKFATINSKENNSF